MARPDPAPDDPADRPAWAGAAGYDPADDRDAPPAPPEPERAGYQRVPEGMAPHAPLPGAPPYPAAPPPSTPRAADATTFPRALAAAAVWLAVNLVLALALVGSVGSLTGVAVLVAFTLVVGLVTWLVARRRTWAFWQLALVAAPVYAIARLVLFPRMM